MRNLPAIIGALAVAAGCAPPVTQNDPVAAPQQQSASIDPIVEFLLSAAARDFHAHGPAVSVFRDVRIGHVTTDGGEKQYRLCGEFLPARDDGKAQWTSFATIKTSDYEQWIGGQGSSFCQEPSMTWDETGDLSSALRSRLDSLR
ncbi:MAG TPA: hypothetical protein VGF40_12295 [Thermoanaerobaculia bacterium]